MVTVTVCMPPGASISAVRTTVNENAFDCAPLPPVPVVPPPPRIDGYTSTLSADARHRR